MFMNINIRESSFNDLPEILNLYASSLDNGAVLTVESAEILFEK